MNKIISLKDTAKIILENNDGKIVGQAIIDIEDIEKVKKHKWHLTNTGYVIGYSKENGTKFLLHTYLKGIEDGKVIDHIDGNKLNNRKYNLRHVTHSLNCLNKKIQKNNSTGKKGVSKITKGNQIRYSASMIYEKRKYYLGVYDNFEEAVYARQQKEVELLGEMLND